MPPYQFTPLSDNKSPTWSNRFLHKLTVVAHPARLQQLHFQPDCFNFLLSYFKQTIHPAISSVGELTLTPFPFVSNSDRHFVVFVIQLHLCSSSSIPSLGAEQRQTGGPGPQARWHKAAPEVFPLFWPRTGKAWRATVTITGQRRNSVDFFKDAIQENDRKHVFHEFKVLFNCD